MEKETKRKLDWVIYCFGTSAISVLTGLGLGVIIILGSPFKFPKIIIFAVPFLSAFMQNIWASIYFQQLIERREEEKWQEIMMKKKKRTSLMKRKSQRKRSQQSQ